MRMLLTAAAFVALFVAPLVAGQAEAQGTQVTVGYADLDLSDPADVAKLDRRIRAAAQAACGKPSAADLEAQNDLARCRADAQARAALQRSQAMAKASASMPTPAQTASR